MIRKSNSPGKTEKTFSLSTSLCLGISLEGIISIFVSWIEKNLKGKYWKL